MFMLSWICIHVHDFDCLCHDDVHMLNEWLRRRQRVCGRLDTARHLCMQHWLFIYIDDDNCVRGLHGHLLHMWCRI